MMEEMMKDGLQPDEYTYGGCIDACAKAGEWGKTRRLLDEMRNAGVNVSLVRCSEFLVSFVPVFVSIAFFLLANHGNDMIVYCLAPMGSSARQVSSRVLDISPRKPCSYWYALYHDMYA